MTKIHKIVIGVVALTLISLTAVFALNSAHNGNAPSAGTPGISEVANADCCGCPLNKTKDTCPMAGACPMEAGKDCCCKDDCKCCDGCKDGNCTCDDCQCCGCCSKNDV